MKPITAHLPGLHFAVALGFLLLGSAALVVYSPALAAGAFLAPPVAAITHLFTLGWITTSIMGALCQFLPQALGQPMRSERLALLTLVLYAPGLLVFVGGVACARPVPLLIGAVALGTGLLIFIGNLGATLRHVARRDLTWWALSLAVFYLTVTLVLGLALAGNLRWGFLGSNRVAAIGVHLHVALAGWVLLVMIGVANRLMPMFLLSPGISDRWARASVALVAAGAGILAFLHHAPAPVGRWLPLAFIALGCSAFLRQARAYYRARRLRDLDPGMRLAAGALAVLASAIVLAIPVFITGAPLQVTIAYVMSIVLAITLFVAAHYYRIIPMLVWVHRFGPLAERMPVPRPTDLFSSSTASLASALLGVGALSLIVLVLTGTSSFVRPAAAVFAAGALLMFLQMLSIWRRKP